MYGADGPCLVDRYETNRSLYQVGDKVQITAHFRAAYFFCMDAVGTIRKIVKPDPASRCKEWVMWVELDDIDLRNLVVKVNRQVSEGYHPEFAEEHLILCKKSGLEVKRKREGAGNDSVEGAGHSAERVTRRRV